MNTHTHEFIPGSGRTVGAALIPLLLAAAAASCSELITSPGSGGPGPTPVTYLSIEGPVAVELGSTAIFKALLKDAAGQTIRDVTQEVLWISSDPTVLSIEKPGLARGLTPGLVSVQVRLGREASALKVGVEAVADPGALPASLMIEGLSVDVFPDLNGHFGYLPRFLLTETSRNSGATILDIVVIGPNGTDSTGPGCWRDRLRVPPGGTLDTFYTDAGLMWLLYCAPGSGGRSSRPELRVIVNFVGDGGQTGKVEAVVNAVTQQKEQRRHRQ